MGMQVLSPEAFATEYPEISKDLPAFTVRPSVHVYDEDVVIEGHLDLEPGEEGERGPVVYLADLTVNGNVLNYSSDYGRALVVRGKLAADNLIGGGAFIRLGDVVVKGVVLGHYNDGSLHGKTLEALMLISSDHDTWFPKKGVELSFEGFSGMERVYIDGVSMDATSSDWQDRLVTAFFYGPLPDFFKGTPWYSFWADTKGEWIEYEGAAPSEHPKLEAEDAMMDWYRWIHHELENEPGPVPASFRAFVDLAKKHIVLPKVGDTDHASG